ncbi:MAG: hypothetical protein KAX99_00835 [Azonexus sp.]|nr:hypothetical protein [Azonexus sp.]MBP8168182.1 hypothetical protein [Azonexus sp.]
MSKQIILHRHTNIEAFREILRASARQTEVQIAEASKSDGPLSLMFKMKFESVGCDPLDRSRKLNLIEQLNQTFTYLASFNGAEYLFGRHPEIQTLTLNLGNRAGWDIETSEDGGVVAEVFAAVTPQNNQKLVKDIEKVSASTTAHRYVLFMSPGWVAGVYRSPADYGGVTVWSLGCDRL